jgi:hypothetical protein
MLDRPWANRHGIFHSTTFGPVIWSVIEIPLLIQKKKKRKNRVENGENDKIKKIIKK